MKTAIVGGGRGCRSLLDLIHKGGLKQLQPDIHLVCDVRSDAPGITFARERGISTCRTLDEVLRLPGLELVVELTGQDAVADEIYHRVPPGVRVIDHMLARLFWDIIQADAAVRRERAYLQKVLDSIPDIVLVVGRGMRVKTTNAAFSRYCDRTREEAVGLLCHEAMCGQERALDTEDHPCPFEEVLKTGERRSIVQVKRKPDGTEEHFELTMTPLRDERGEIQEVVEALHPITERVILRRDVEAFAQRFRQFIDSADDLISIKDLGGRYQVVNQATADFLGVSIEDCVGQRIADLTERRIADLVVAHDQEVIESGKAITYEEILPWQGEDRYFNTIRFPLFDYFGDVVGVCTISRDFTREKRLQRELQHADKLAAIGKLAAGVAHEINNPLTGILAYAEDLLEEAEEDDPRRQDYEVIIRETLRCRGIVRNLLDFSRQTKPRMRTEDLNAVVERVLALVERLATFRDIRIERGLCEDLPPIRGDAAQLQQVILNLLVNAAEKMPRGGRIIIRTEPLDEGRQLSLTVCDDGPGIPPELVDRIFEPFFSTKETTQGLGLAVSWGIVDRHGGTIEATNREGGGACFRVILPAGGGDDG